MPFLNLEGSTWLCKKAKRNWTFTHITLMNRKNPLMSLPQRVIKLWARWGRGNLLLLSDMAPGFSECHKKIRRGERRVPRSRHCLGPPLLPMQNQLYDSTGLWLCGKCMRSHCNSGTETWKPLSPDKTTSAAAAAAVARWCYISQAFKVVAGCAGVEKVQV